MDLFALVHRHSRILVVNAEYRNLLCQLLSTTVCTAFFLKKNIILFELAWKKLESKHSIESLGSSKPTILH
jgi:hypothetical protein